MSATRVILIGGKKRVGKDYFASRLKVELEKIGYKAEIMSFATPMKTIIAWAFGISMEQLDKLKNDNAPILCVDDDNTRFIAGFRNFLQRFGTEGMMEYFGERVWADMLYSRIQHTDAEFVIVPDFRFRCEYCEGAITVNVQNSDIDSHDSHASENELNDFDFMYTVDNTGHPDMKEVVRDFFVFLDSIA